MCKAHACIEMPVGASADISLAAPVLQLQLPTALTCNPVTTNISGTPIYSPVDYILATQPAGPPDTIPSCGAGTAYPTSLAANTTSGGRSRLVPGRRHQGMRACSCSCKCWSQFLCEQS